MTVFNINIFTPNLRDRDAFLAAQLEGLPGFGEIPGWAGTRLFTEDGGGRMIAIAGFESVEAHRAFMSSAAFQAHRARLLPMIRESESAYYRLVLARNPERAQGAAADQAPLAHASAPA